MKMKKLITMMGAAVLMCLSCVCFAATSASRQVADTALFVQIDPIGVGKPKETEQLICKDIEAKLNASHHTIVSTEKTQQDLRIYLRENGEEVTKREADKGYILKSSDFKNLAHLENVRFVVLVSSRITSLEEKKNFWSDTRKNITVLTEVVIYDTKDNKYVLSDEYTTIGKTSGSNDRAYSRAIKEMLEKVAFNY